MSAPYDVPTEFVAYALTWYWVFGASPVMELVYVPVPVPSVVQLLLVAGLDDVAQHTPLAVTIAPPSEVTFPPPEAVTDVMFVTEVVVTVGACAAVAVTVMVA
jgi:hypothetical protein